MKSSKNKQVDLAKKAFLKKLKRFQKKNAPKKKTIFSTTTDDSHDYRQNSRVVSSKTRSSQLAGTEEGQTLEDKDNLHSEQLQENLNLRNKIKTLQQQKQQVETERNDAIQHSKELFEKVNLNDIPLLIAKATEYDNLQRQASYSRFYKTTFFLLKDWWEVHAMYRLLRHDIKKALDDFQRIKVYRQFFQRLKISPNFQDLVLHFIKNDDNMKNIVRIKEVVLAVKKRLYNKKMIDDFFSHSESAIK